MLFPVDAFTLKVNVRFMRSPDSGDIYQVTEVIPDPDGLLTLVRIRTTLLEKRSENPPEELVVNGNATVWLVED